MEVKEGGVQEELRDREELGHLKEEDETECQNRMYVEEDEDVEAEG